jgi:hypothetical protein
MRKTVFWLDDEIIEERPRSRLPLVFFGLFLLVGLGPLALEGSAICLANWKEFMGVSASVRTPILDGVQERLHNLSEDCWGEITPWFRALPWRPKMVLPIAGVIMAFAMLLLRR